MDCATRLDAPGERPFVSRPELFSRTLSSPRSAPQIRGDDKNPELPGVRRRINPADPGTEPVVVLLRFRITRGGNSKSLYRVLYDVDMPEEISVSGELWNCREPLQ